MVKQARAVATRQQIITGAARMFERSGFDGASLGDIVDGAGTTKGALYFHFRSKDELAHVVIDEQQRASAQALEAIAATGASPLRQIVMLCHDLGGRLVTDPIVRAGMRLTIEFGDGNGSESPFAVWIDDCRRIVEAGVAQGEITATVEAPVLARFVIESFTGVQVVSKVLTGRQDLPERIDAMWRILLPAVATTRDPAELDDIRAARWTATEPSAHAPATRVAVEV